MFKYAIATFVLVVGAVLVAPVDASLMIDDFATGGTTLTLAHSEINKFSLETGLAGPSIYKDRRYSQLDWQPQTNGNVGDSATLAVNSGGSGVASITKVGEPRFWFGYGQWAFDSTWDEDWSGADKALLKITFAGAGAPEKIRVKFYINGDIGGVNKYLNDEILFDPGQKVGYYALSGTSNPQNVDIDLLRQHVTGMAVYYVGANNGTMNWALDKVELVPVPEPATMGMLAIGGMGLLSRRRRNK